MSTVKVSAIGVVLVVFLCTVLAPRRERVIAAGRFHGVAHKGSGTARVYQRADGKHVLRLTNFQTAARPDLEVYLISESDARDNDTVMEADFLFLGALHNATGDQCYVLPPSFDPARYRAVTVWSYKYKVNFTTAPLKPN